MNREELIERGATHAINRMLPLAFEFGIARVQPIADDLTPEAREVIAGMALYELDRNPDAFAYRIILNAVRGNR